MSRGQNTKDQIVFIGDSGFPVGFAAIQRITLMAKALVREGCKVTVVCRKGVWEQGEQINLSRTGNFEGIEYIYTSDSVFRPKGFIKRNIQKFKGLFGEFIYLRQLKNQDRINVAILSNMSVFHALRYRLYSGIIGFPIVLNLVEMSSSIQHRAFFLTRINDYILDKLVIKLYDGALPISDTLMDYYHTMSASKPVMKLPILCDFEKFDKTNDSNAGSYFLYCGSTGYIEVIRFVLEAYRKVLAKDSTKLYMIVSGGGKSETVLLQEEINKSFNTDQIKLFSNIPYDQLVDLYTNAKALLIPLRPTRQDSARFPHKIGEYLASGNPVITTDVGEIKNYFEGGKTALVADLYDIDTFAEKMQYVLDYPEDSKKIGANGKELGLAEFDYRTHGVRVRMFLQEI